MENSAEYLPLLADIVVGAVLLIALIIGAKRGLLRSLIGVAVVGLSLLGATWCAKNLTEPISQWVTPWIEKRLMQESPFAELQIKVPDFLSGLVENIREIGHSFLTEKVGEMVNPVVYAAVYLVTFLLLLVLLRLFGKLLRIMEKLPVIKTCNRFGGAVLGLVSGAVIISVVLWAVGRFNWLPPETLQDSFFAKYFTAGMWIQNEI